MPISFKIYEDRGFFLSTWIGDISDSDLLSSYKQLLEDEKYKPGFNEIADARNAKLSGISSDGYYKLFRMVESHIVGKCEGMKTAIIAPEDFTFGMSRMYEMISDEKIENVEVFREPSEAVKWIGIVDFHIE